MFGLNERTLAAIETCLQQYPDISWVKIYGSRAKGNFQRGSDIDLAFSCPVNCAAKLLDELDNLPTPYLFDVTHYESLKNEALKSHIDRVGVPIYRANNSISREFIKPYSPQIQQQASS